MSVCETCRGYGYARGGACWACGEATKVQRVVQESGGYWHSCSGCFESEDGHASGDYPHSPVFGCQQGGGCSECGGLGAVWADLYYVDAMLEGAQDEAPSTCGMEAAGRNKPSPHPETEARIAEKAFREGYEAGTCDGQALDAINDPDDAWLTSETRSLLSPKGK